MLTTETQTFKALQSVKASCDNAHSSDGKGFSSYDATFAHDLINKGAKWGWTEKQFAAAKRIAHKYRVQIKAKGYDPAQIAAEEIPNVRERQRSEEVFGYVRYWYLHRETDKAMFVFLERDSKYTVCIPKSQVKATLHHPVSGGRNWIQIPEWLIRDKGLTVDTPDPRDFPEVQPVATTSVDPVEAVLETERQFRDERVTRRLLEV